jgi:hypothetical protein
MENTAISGWSFNCEIVSEYATTILECTENTRKEYKRHAWSILSYMENTPIDIKLSLYRQIFDQNQKNQILNDMIEWAKNYLTLLSL